jgi:hypothetical protein
MAQEIQVKRYPAALVYERCKRASASPSLPHLHKAAPQRQSISPGAFK